jgi:hypothetical protein
LAWFVNDHFIAGHLSGAFASWTIIALRAGAKSDARGTLDHFENSHAQAYRLWPRRGCAVLLTFNSPASDGNLVIEC